MIRCRLQAKEERRLLRGHLWAYRNEFAEIPETEDGEVVDVFSAQGRFVGRGFYQAQGGIAVRLLARRQCALDAAFLAEKLETALRFRERIFPGENVYRWVFGESDGLPGLVADRYGSLVSAQTACSFYRSRADALAQAFLSHDGVTGVRFVVCDQVQRFGDVPAQVECVVDGAKVGVAVEAGQKTGMFLDQRANAFAARRYASGARVLDAHCYIGLWTVHAALAGAAHVTAVDTSAPAVELAEANARRNGVEAHCEFACADVTEVLQRGDTYDLIVLDPPAFAKSHAHERKALGLYQTLNSVAMKAVASGGVLVTSSCSHFVSREWFMETLKRAATQVQRQVWILEERGAAPDHPVLMAMPETAYLKCVVLRVL